MALLFRCRHKEKISSQCPFLHSSLVFFTRFDFERLANTAPGFLRRAVKDIPVKGFIIQAGWTIMLALAALHLSPNIFNDPIEYNPWHWKDLRSDVISNNFMPFGRGRRQCPGAEYTRVFMATFLHVLVTKYRWTKIKGGDIARNPILGFGIGIHIRFSEKYN